MTDTQYRPLSDCYRIDWTMLYGDADIRCTPPASPQTRLMIPASWWMQTPTNRRHSRLGSYSLPRALCHEERLTPWMEIRSTISTASSVAGEGCRPWGAHSTQTAATSTLVKRIRYALSNSAPTLTVAF